MQDTRCDAGSRLNHARRLVVRGSLRSFSNRQAKGRRQSEFVDEYSSRFEITQTHRVRHDFVKAVRFCRVLITERLIFLVREPISEPKDTDVVHQPCCSGSTHILVVVIGDFRADLGGEK